MQGDQSHVGLQNRPLSWSGVPIPRGTPDEPVCSAIFARTFHPNTNNPRINSGLEPCHDELHICRCSANDSKNIQDNKTDSGPPPSPSGCPQPIRSPSSDMIETTGIPFAPPLQPDHSRQVRTSYCLICARAREQPRARHETSRLFERRCAGRRGPTAVGRNG